MPNTSILPDIPEESIDAPKKFKNIDNESFDCTWDNIIYTVQPGEVVTHPKYLVNYMAMHLARKMYKRKQLAEFVGSEWEKSNANIRLSDPEEEKKLQEQMVAVNFEGISETSKIEEVKMEETKEFKCAVCGKTFETSNKLRGHQMGAKHR